MSNVPAVLVCDAGTGNLKVAGLTVLDRMVVTAHRAGCTPITVVSDEAPSLARAQAIGIEIVYEGSAQTDAVAAALCRRAGVP